jgi:hypothetical protein
MSVVHWLAEDAYQEVNDLPAPQVELTVQRDVLRCRHPVPSVDPEDESAARNK